MRVLHDLGAEPTAVRQQVIRLVHADRGRDEAGSAPAGRGKRKVTSGLLDRLGSVEWRLSILEQRVGTGPGVRQLDQEIAQVRRDKEHAEVQDFETAASLRDREQQLLADKAAREQEWAILPSLSEEVERLRELLRQHGIDPRDGAARRLLAAWVMSPGGRFMLPDRAGPRSACAPGVPCACRDRWCVPAARPSPRHKAWMSQPCR
jgi:hypothetical protein